MHKTVNRHCQNTHESVQSPVKQRYRYSQRRSPRQITPHINMSIALLTQSNKQPELPAIRTTRSKKRRIIIVIDAKNISYQEMTCRNIYVQNVIQIKFDSKTDLLGMGKAKKWILLANYWDKTLMRNAVTYHLANEEVFNCAGNKEKTLIRSRSSKSQST